MTANARWKVATYVSSFLGTLALLLYGVSFLSPLLSLVGTLFILFSFLISSIFALDMMVPGVNLFSHAMTRLPRSVGNLVTLTFDDGPSVPFTKEILAILDRYNVKATFFCIGENVRAHPELAKEIVSRGHLIANHTSTHRPLPWLATHEIENEIQGGIEAIETATGVKTHWFRCPKGFKSAKVARIARELGAKIIGFSYPLFDIQNPPPQELVDRLLSKARGGDIILMHDGFQSQNLWRRDSLVSALPSMIEGLRAKGLQIARLDEALGQLPQWDAGSSPMARQQVK